MQPNGGRVSAKNPTSTTYSKSPNWSPPLVEIQEAIIAALLHDAIEDQEISREMIAEQFARIVVEVTDDKSVPWQERKAAQIAIAAHKSRSAKLIKLADKISNVRSVAATPPVDWSTQRRRNYIEFCAAVVNELLGVICPQGSGKHGQAMSHCAAMISCWLAERPDPLHGVWVLAGTTVACIQQPPRFAVSAAFPPPEKLCLSCPNEESWDGECE
jgi:uncharacterized protein (UPF0147 family)